MELEYPAEQNTGHLFFEKTGVEVITLYKNKPTDRPLFLKSISVTGHVRLNQARISQRGRNSTKSCNNVYFNWQK